MNWKQSSSLAGNGCVYGTLLDAEIKYNNDNPFKDMVDFKHIEQYITNYTN